MKAILVTIAGMMSICLTAQAAQISCKQVHQRSSPLLSLLKEADVLSPSEPGTVSPEANQSRFKMFNAVGADAVSLFGSDFNNWPMLLGVSGDGHIILAQSDPATHDIRILSLKKLNITTHQYNERVRQDVSVATGQSRPSDYEKTETWLQKSEGAFNQITQDFGKTNHLWVIEDYNYHQLTGAVQTSGAFGTFEQPWIVRQARLYTPTKDGKSASRSTPEEIESLVQALLQSK